MINIGILAADEVNELTRLLQNLIIECKVASSQIVILFDTDKVTPEMYQAAAYYGVDNVFQRSLDMDFAAQRNHLHSLCPEEYILHVDADETITPELLKAIDTIIETYGQFDRIAIPRVNKLILDDPDIDPVEIFGPTAMDAEGRINWPDYQWRLLRNSPDVAWGGVIHEQPSGSKVYFMRQSEDVAIQHVKNISKQLEQRDFYRTIKQ